VKDPETKIDLLKSLESFFSIALVVAVAMLCFLLWLIVVPRMQAKAQVEAAAQQAAAAQAAKDAEAEKLKSIEERQGEIVIPDPVLSEEEIQVLLGKVSRIIESLPLGDRRELVRLLAQKNREGRIKAAYAIEAWFSTHNSQGSETGDGELFTWLNGLDLPMRRKVDLIAEWRSLPNLTNKERGRFVNELFWDLIAFKTLGSFAVEKPFEYMSDLTADEVKNLIGSKDPRMQSMILLFLPAQLQKNFLSRVPKERQQEILRGAFLAPTVDVATLDTAHLQLKKEVSLSLDRRISVIDKLGELLSQMDVLDEIVLLRQTVAQFGHEGAQFKTKYPTLAFIDEWSDRTALAVLASEATTDEIVSLITELPQLEERILATCSPMIATIVKEDLRLAPRKQRQDRRQELTSLSGKLKKLVNEEKIDLDSLFTQVADNVVKLSA
ncbi:MAG: hypothetical protein V4692_11735, partial [Bdellovibrionota bacterium]